MVCVWMGEGDCKLRVPGAVRSALKHSALRTLDAKATSSLASVTPKDTLLQACSCSSSSLVVSLNIPQPACGGGEASSPRCADFVSSRVPTACSTSDSAVAISCRRAAHSPCPPPHPSHAAHERVKWPRRHVAVWWGGGDEKESLTWLPEAEERNTRLLTFTARWRRHPQSCQTHKRPILIIRRLTLGRQSRRGWLEHQTVQITGF